ncbi:MULTISPECIES: tripartite tricarboxylate transporter substrate binding protein [unclassified Halomonas]|uniref:Bug family tripartite tricarboxylate transporter substrate binding protein n=1 Tax=unclassified Halomonas TaxID=2609666 RepID=UPI002076A30E|nr:MULTISPECIES: tripartite tricarboxylate transporter substrate binding protein [unclassified Halomonas]
MKTEFKNNTRRLLTSLALVAIVPLASAQDYPNKPVKVIVPFPAGGSTDLMARATARELAETLGQNVVVDNRGGGAGTIGVAALARERPDGYTLGVVPAATLVNQPHMRRTPYDLDQFDYICQLFSSPMALAVKPDSPFENLNQLVDYAKEHPNELTYGTPGPGTLMHLAMEQFLQIADIELEHVPFTGDAPAATALLGGHIDLYMSMTNVVNDRGLASIGVFSEEPAPSLPEVETAIEQGYDITAAWWGGLVAPQGLEDGVKSRLVESCQSVVYAERFAQTLEDLGADVHFRDPDDFEAYVRGISETNAQLIETVFKGE